MNNKTIVVIISMIIAIVILFGFFVIYNQETIKGKEPISIDSTDSEKNVDETNSEIIGEIVEESEYFKLIRSNLLYYCYFYDNNNEVVKEEGPMGKLPKITVVEANILKFTLQAGTGTGTRWGYYYDTENTIFSTVFTGIFDEYDGKVACVGLNKVVVSDIFDSSKYYKEFSEFTYSFSPSATPITNIEFSEDGKSIVVSYLTGSDYQEVTEIFLL